MNISVITLFPELVQSVCDCGVIGRAVKNERFSFKTINPRDFTVDSHRTVDDRPYGGGPGMVMKPQPLQLAIQHAKKKSPAARAIYMSPQGKPLSQDWLVDAANNDTDLILLAGRYEGVDERLINAYVDEEVSIGDYVLSGGELAAMVVIDGIVRLLPDVLGHRLSAEQDSFTDGLLDCPHYTRPEIFEGQEVPSVLRSGDHAAIAKWRRKEALLRTQQRRPDLLLSAKLNLTKADYKVLSKGE